jgi:hypothetical protein
MKVKKIGRTTGLTKGIVEAELVPFPMPYKLKHFTATVWFKEVWSIRADPGTHFALAGASAAVGLIFAASPTGDTAAVVPMDHVISCCGGLAMVSGHGV